MRWSGLAFALVLGIILGHAATDTGGCGGSLTTIEKVQDRLGGT